jgi:hypothetical protein
MDRLDRLEQVAKKAEELLAKVQALKTVGYLKLVSGESGDTFPLKLIDTATMQTKHLLNHKNKEEMKALRIAVREYNKKKESV